MDIESKNKILVLQTAYIGDVIVSTGLVRELKGVIPNSQIDIITTPKSAEIFDHNPYIRETIEFDKENWKYYNFYKLVKKLRPRDYDLSLSIQSSPTSGLLLYFSGIKERIGFEKQILTTISVPDIEKPSRHRSESIVNLLSPLAPEKDFDNTTELFFSEQERRKAEKILSNSEGEIVIGLAPGSVRNTKKWPEKNYAELARRLDLEGVSLIFIGGPQERELCDRIITNSNNKSSINLAGQLSILESSAVIEKLDLILTNDSAPLHMANAVNTDVFAFFGPTVKKYGFFPYRKGDKLFEVDLECRPCSLHGGPRCPEGHHNCMKRIKPEYVVEQIQEKFSL